YACFYAYLPTRRSPTDQGRHCSRKRSDHCTQWSFSFERCVEEDIASKSEYTNKAAKQVDEEHQISDTKNRSQGSEQACSRRRDPARRKRSSLSPPHHLVEVPLEILIQCSYACGKQPNAKTHMQEQKRIDRAFRCEPETGHCCQQNQDQYARFRKLDVGCNRSCNRPSLRALGREWSGQ